MFLSEGMGTIYSFLVELLRTTGNPLLFRIAGWAVSQFGEWLVENLAQLQMDELMQLLLTRMMSDTNCVSVLVEKGEEKLVGYYDAIIKAISQCFGFYGVGGGGGGEA